MSGWIDDPCCLSKSQHFIEISDFWGNFDSSWKELAGQCADFVALVEDGLNLCVRFREQVFGGVGVPEQLGALQAPKVFGFGNE